MTSPRIPSRPFNRALHATLTLLALTLASCLPENRSSIPTLTVTQTSNPREDFLKIITREKVPLAPELSDPTTTNEFTQIRFSYQTQSGQRVPGILLKLTASTGKHPAVIALHGTGGTKTGELPLMRQLARKGLIAVAIDARYHGDRAQNRTQHPNDYEQAIIKAYSAPEPHEHPFFYDTVWDVIRLLDYLQTRDDVDPARIGLIGTSKGGIEAYFTAAVDPRVTAVVPMIGVQSFQWALETNNWKGRIATIQPSFDAIKKDANVDAPDSAFVQKFYDRVVPGIYAEFDCPRMLELIAPRPLMIINGDQDPNCPLGGVKIAIAAAQKAYHEKSADDRLIINIQPNTPHRVNPDSQSAAIDFLAKHLTPKN